MADDFNDPPPFADSTGIFLSAAPADEAEAARLGTALAGYGLPVLPRPSSAERETEKGKQRIQRDIQACELFLPIVSAGSNASADGSFRSEWQQAAERAAAKTGSLPFLVPLVTEDISASASKVPEAFRGVPWVSLPGAGAETVLVARLQEMLRQHESFRLRNPSRPTAPVVVPVFAPQPEAPDAVLPPAPDKISPLMWTLIAAGAAAALLVGFFAARPTEVTTPAPAVSSAAPSVVSAVPTPTPLPLPVPASATEAKKVLLAATSNLTGDSSVDATARALDPQFSRALSRLNGVRVETGNAAELPAGLTAARRANAGVLVLINLSRTGQNLELRAQVVFAASGISYGILGPVRIDSAASSSAVADFTERVTTGVAEAGDLLLHPPSDFTKVAYGRSWARWPLAQQSRDTAALPVHDTERRIAGALAILREEPSMLDTRLLLGRALRDAGRYNEADSAFGEVFARRALISQAELQELLYDRSLLLGAMPAALPAAREKSVIWPLSDAIDELVATLFALNRPGDAAAEMTSWLAGVKTALPPAELTRRETEIAVLTTLAHVRHGETARAQTALTAVKNRLGPTGSLTTLELEILTSARSAAQADFDRLLDRLNDLPSLAPLASVRLAYILYCQMLHAGRPAEAAHFLDRAKRFWTARPAGLSTTADAASLLLEVDLNLAQNRPADALAALDRATAPLVATRPLDFDGRRALALQDLGRAGDFATMLNKLESIDLRNSRGFPLYWRARLAARAGLQKSAIELLRLAIAQGLWLDDPKHFATSYGRHEPEFAALRGLSGYDDLLGTQN